MGSRSSKPLRGYQQYGVVGEGSFGTVVAAKSKKEHKTKTSKLVALKFQSLSKLLKDYTHAEDAQKELDFLIKLQSLNCPFIMGLKEAFMTKYDLVLVMPLLLGGDLRYHLDAYGKFEYERVRLVAAEMICGLEAIHSLELVYRDIKPENIVFDEKGHIRITDFDRSRYVEKKHSKCVMEFTGTPGYMAPELINNQKYDQAIDVFGMGILTYELLHEALPFPPEISTENEVTEKSFIEPDYLPRLDKHFRDLIRQMFAFDPRKRIGCKNPTGFVLWSEIKSHECFNCFDWQKVARGEVIPLAMLSINDKVQDIKKLIKKPKNTRAKSLPLSEKEARQAARIFKNYRYPRSLHSSKTLSKNT